MTDRPTADGSDDPPAAQVARARQCLRCRESFASEWSGERICPRCKGTAAWRAGVPPQYAPNRKPRG